MKKTFKCCQSGQISPNLWSHCSVPLLNLDIKYLSGTRSFQYLQLAKVWCRQILVGVDANADAEETFELSSEARRWCCRL